MDIERECSLLGTLFHNIVTDLKSNSPAWEDFVNKGTKLHSLLKSTSAALSAFVESIQKIADATTNTKGSTKDIGSALTRICVRQKMMENKLKHFTNSLMDNLICPVQERLEEWKKSANQLEKDHTKEYKKAMNEIKKRNSDTMRLQKKVRKGSKSDLQVQLSTVMDDVNGRYAVLEEREKSALRNLLVEERSRICLFANCLSPVLDLQVSMLNEVSHLHELTSDVARLCRNPKQLPTSTEQLVKDFIAANSQLSSQQDNQTNYFLNQTNGLSPPSTPTSNDSRKSSICSLNSLASSDSRSSGSLNRTSSFHHNYYQGYHRRTSSGGAGTTTQGSPTSCKSAPSGAAVPRLSSVSSYDSGFASAGNGAQTFQSSGKAAVPDDPVTELSRVLRPRAKSTQLPDTVSSPSGPNKDRFSWKDWSKPGPYDMPRSPESKTALWANAPRRKNSEPPPLSPKPAYFVEHRLSMEDVPKTTRPPLQHTKSSPHFFPPTFPEKEELSLPPPPPELTCSLPGRQVDDPLPPPPPPTTLYDDNSSPRLQARTDFPSNAEDETNHFHPSYKASSYQSDVFPSQQCDPVHTIPRYEPPTENFHAMALCRKSSNNSLHYSTSSGYSSQHTTPACSEDTIASHDADLNFLETEEHSQHLRNGYNYEKFSTVPRNYHHGNNNGSRATSNHHKRPASTAGIPGSNMIATQIETPGTATIRRKPSSKFNSVRKPFSLPKPVQTPTVPNSSIGSLMATFIPPTSYVNSNNNSTCVSSAGLPQSYGHSESNVRQNKESLSRDLTLRFQPGIEPVDGSPTPTMTPTFTECIQSHNNGVYGSNARN